MDAKDLKKILAGMCIASLISGSALTLGGCAGKSA
jgi:radical SAM modification target selenobiotic family peptide